VTAFIDTNVLIRHLTGDPPDLAGRATVFLAAADELLLADLIVAETVYVLAGSASISSDGGATFSGQLPSMGGDFHAMWIDASNPKRFYLGNDKGAYLSFDGGTTVKMFDNMAIGQFYAVTVDNRDPYWVYGGLQDNGNWGGPSNSRDVNGILNDHWFKFHSGDGFHATVDPNDWRTVYTESQGGNIRRLDAVFRQQGGSITPRPDTVDNFDGHVSKSVPFYAEGQDYFNRPDAILGFREAGGVRL